MEGQWSSTRGKIMTALECASRQACWRADDFEDDEASSDWDISAPGRSATSGPKALVEGEEPRSSSSHQPVDTVRRCRFTHIALGVHEVCHAMPSEGSSG